MKILVTGAYGQLGNEIKVLSENFQHWDFLFTDADTLDITNEKDVSIYFKKHMPGLVINCAAYTAVDKAETDVKNALNINAVAPGILAKASREQKSGFIHISTDYVFDGTSYKPYSEFDAVNPQTTYGKTKLAGEHAVRSGNPRSVIIRTSWLYSSFGHNFLKTMMHLGKERESIKVVFDQTGTPTYAADLAEAILSITSVFEEFPENFVPGIYHYSNEGVASWYDFAETIFGLGETKCRVIPVLSHEFPSPAKRPHYSVLNKSKIKTAFNLEIPYWKESLKECITKL
jgi:dTDP-4-dehydrorhamnose reductase